MSAGGGGGGTPLKVLFEILGINEAKTQLQSVIPEVEKIGSASQATGGKMKVLGDSLRESGDAGKALSPIATNLEKIEVANVKATTSVTDLTKATGDEIKVVEKLDTINKERVSTQEDVIKGTENLVRSEENSVTTKEDLVKSTDKLNTEVDESSKTSDKAAQSQDKLEKSSNETTSAINKEEKSIKTLGTEAQKGGQNINKLGQETKASGVASETAGKKNEGLKANMTALMGSTASLAGGITSLWQTYDSLGDAQLRVEKSSLMVSRAQEAYEKATAKVNQLVAEGKTGTAEYSAALLDQEQASTKLNVAKGAEINSQEDLNIANAEFYQQIGPQLITTFGSLATIIGTVATTSGTLKTKITEMAADFITKIKGMQTGAVGLSTTLKGIGLTNPFFIALTVGAGIMTAFVTNVFGIRDAINGLGVAIGNAIGPLKPFLTMLGDLGKGLVDMLGMGGDAEKAFAATTEESMGTAGGAIEGLTGSTDKTLSNIQKFGLDMGQTFVDSNGVVQGYKADFSQAATDIGAATNQIPTKVAENVNKTTSHFNKLIADANKTVKEVETVFSRTVALGDIKVSGISGISNLKNEPRGLGQELQSMRGKQGASQELIDTAKIKEVTAAMSELNKVMVFYEAETGRTFVNNKQLDALLASNAISFETYEAVINKVIPAMNGHLLSTDANVSMSGELRDTIQQLTPITEESAKATDTLATSQQGVVKPISETEKAFKVLVDNMGKVVASSASIESANTRINASGAQLNTEFEYYSSVLADVSLSQELITQGAFKQDLAMKQQQATLLETVSGLNKYNEQLGTAEGKQTAQAQGMANQLDTFVKMKVAVQENVGVYTLLKQQLAEGEIQVLAYEKAYGDTLIKLANGILEVEAIRGETDALTASLKSGEAQQIAYNKGLAEQERQIKLDIIANEELRGKLQELKNQWASGEAQITSFNNGVLNQAIAFEDQKKAIVNTFGAIVQMRKEYANGDAVFVAYMQGLTDTAKAFEDQKRAIDSNRASLAQIQRQNEDYSGSLVSFREGFTQTELEMAKAKQTTDSLVGSFTALLIKIYEGEAGTQAYKDGWAESSKTFLDSIVAVDKLRGSLDSMEARMTVEKVNAFANGIQQMRQQLMDAEIATANTYGQIQLLQSTIGSFNEFIARFDKGFADSYKSVVEWAAGLDTAKGAADGAAAGFAEMQKRLGVDLPAGFNLSQEAAQEWIEVQEGVPGTMNKIVDAANQAGVALQSSLVEGFRGGADALDDEFDKLEEKLGFELTEAMRDSLKPGVFAQSTKQYLDEEFAALQGSQVGTKGWKQMADAMMAKMGEAIKQSPHLATAGQAVIDAIQAVKLHPGQTQYIADLGLAIQNYGTLAGGSVKPAEQFNAAAGNSQGITRQANALDTSARFMLAYNEAIAAGATASEALAAGNDAASKALTATGTGATGASTGMDTATTSATALTTEADATYQKMNILAQALGLLGPATSVAVGLANTEFGKLNPLQSTYVTGMTNITTALSLLGPAAGVAVGLANTEFAKLNPTQPQYTANMDTLAKSLGLLGPATGMAVSQANTAFAKLNPTPSQFTSNMNRLAQSLGLLGPATGVAVGQANTAFAKLNPLQSTYTNGMTLLAKSLSLLPGATAQVVTKANASWTSMGTVSSRVFTTLSSQSKTAAAAVNSALQSMASRASSTFSSISSSASRAVSGVRSLISTINSLRSKTVTITTVYRRVIQTVYAAKGFGPAVVSSPMNLTVGEAGKELVSVIPLDNNRAGSGGGRAFDHSAAGTSSITTNSTYSTIRGGNKSNISSASNNSSSSSLSSANSISGTTINRFNEAVSRITNTFEKQESIMNASYTTGINSIRNGGVYSSNPTTIGGNTVNSMTTSNVPSYNTINRRSSNSNVFGGSSGLDAGSIIAMVKDIITQAMSNTTINLNNVTNVDGDVVYNSQKKRFGLNNGSMLK